MITVQGLAIGVAVGALALGLSVQNAAAEPFLQLDISGGTYLGAPEETIISTSSAFSLVALQTPQNNDPFDTTTKFYISAAIVIGPGHAGVANGTNFGSFSLDGTSYSLADMVFGTPPPEDPDLPTHGVYDTLYQQFEFMFDTGHETATYNSMTDPGAANLGTGTGSLYHEFAIDVSGLTDPYQVHFDLYSYTSTVATSCSADVTTGNPANRVTYHTQADCEGAGGAWSEVTTNNIVDKAPFSHDAQSWPPGDNCTDGNCTVPEPMTLALFGAGLLGLGIIRRRKFAA